MKRSSESQLTKDDYEREEAEGERGGRGEEGEEGEEGERFSPNSSIGWKQASAEVLASRK